MANLTNINRCSQETFDSIVDGTHATETYDSNAIYAVELEEPLQVGSSGTGLLVNDDNQLAVDTDTIQAKLTAGVSMNMFTQLEYVESTTIASYTVTGAESWTVSNTGYIKSDACDAWISLTGMASQGSNSVGCCNRLKNSGSIWTTVGYPNCFAFNSNQFHVNIANDLLGITDPSSETTSTACTKIKTWLAAQYAAGTPVIVYYPLTTAAETANKFYYLEGGSPSPYTYVPCKNSSGAVGLYCPERGFIDTIGNSSVYGTFTAGPEGGSNLFIDTTVPKCTQTTAGTYKLTATVDSSGNVTYSWVTN